MTARRTQLPPHVFAVDPDVPPDRNGHHACRCGLVGEPGDTHHTMPDRPADADAREMAAGEKRRN